MKIRLTECGKPFLCTETIFTFTCEYPFDKEPVDFMLCEYHSGKPDRCEFALYCVSGYHSGSLEYVFPKEAVAQGAAAISTQWLRENWKSKVYGGCEAAEVTVLGWDEINIETKNQI